MAKILDYQANPANHNVHKVADAADIILFEIEHMEMHYHDDKRPAVKATLRAAVLESIDIVEKVYNAVKQLR